MSNNETRPCLYCDTPVELDVWEEELHMCVDCSNKFYSHVINPYDPATFPKNMETKDECTCDPCDDRECDCRHKRCDFCSQEDKTVEPDFATELQRIVQKERDRIADNLLKHSEVCKYKAVTEENCDVCHYLNMAAKIVRTGEEF